MSAKFLARIREAECVGCTKCIDVCPVDAIVGAANQMHTVLRQECIGCKLCVPPCPVDCIELIPWPTAIAYPQPEQIKSRAYQRKKRLEQINANRADQPSLMNRKQYIAAAIARANIKK